MNNVKQVEFRVQDEDGHVHPSSLPVLQAMSTEMLEDYSKTESRQPLSIAFKLSEGGITTNDGATVPVVAVVITGLVQKQSATEDLTRLIQQALSMLDGSAESER